MKNIWKNAIYFLSLIGLMTFVSSCGDSDGGTTPEETTSATYKSTSITVENDPNNESGTVDGTITIVVESTGKITVSGIDAAWGLKPTGFTNSEYTVETFNALGWTSGSVSSDAPASTVTLVYDENKVSSAKVKGLLPKYTYTFSKQ